MTPVAAEPNLPQPAGPVAQAGIDELVRLIDVVYPAGPKSTMETRRRSLRRFGEHLAEFPGDTWQDRWLASEWETSDRLIRSMNTDRHHAWTMSAGYKLLAAFRAIVPSVRALRRHALPDYHDVFIAVQDDPLLDEVAARIRKSPASPRYQGHALGHLAFALTSQAIPMADLTAAALMHFAWEYRAAAPAATEERWPSHLIRDVLVEIGHFPSGTPPTMRLAMVGARHDVPQMVDRYGIRHPEVRQLLIDYLNHRVVEGMDYSTIEGLPRHLVRNFWAVIEEINPDQADLRLDEATYQAWREEIDVVRTKESMRPRADLHSLLLAVRAFYLDLQSWAPEAPERWARWVAPCPTPQTMGRSYAQARRRLTERMADRARLRQPLLPLLVEHVRQRHEHYQGLEAAALAAGDGAIVEFAGRSYRRLPIGKDTVRARVLRQMRHSQVRLRDLDSGDEIIVQHAAKRVFWAWALVEVLRLTGIRSEELLELSQLSIRQYQRPNGEVVALLVIAPSKTDRERVIPMSAELFHVVAEIIRHHTHNGGSIPLARRWDSHQREHSPPLPFLFQHQVGVLRQGFSGTWALKELRRVCDELAQTHPEFAGARFTPHDFRRIFATDLVNNGLPIHIGAALLGHTSLQTTRGYVAVFDDDVVRHYQQFLDHRRQLRPTEEYRPTTDQEWAEFEDHFDKRKVELGGCARPYGTPCSHEHACIRCPMLQVNPKMLPRLDELEAGLLARRDRAQQEGWLGEIDGLDLTLNYLRQKRDDARHIARAGPVEIGMPAGLRASPGEIGLRDSRATSDRP
ncbi:site-specific integrase [Actinomycetes bacterium KLBMP 9759]